MSDRKDTLLYGQTTDDGTSTIGLGAIANGQTVDYIVTWLAKKPDTLARICGVTRFVATNNGGTIDFLGSDPEIVIQSPEFDAALDGATLTGTSSTNNVQLVCTGVASVGDVYWFLEISERLIHQ